MMAAVGEGPCGEQGEGHLEYFDDVRSRQECVTLGREGASRRGREAPLPIQRPEDSGTGRKARRLGPNP